VVSFTPWPFNPRERAPSNQWIGGSVGPRNRLDKVSKRKIPNPDGNRTPIVQPVVSCYINSNIIFPSMFMSSEWCSPFTFISDKISCTRRILISPMCATCHAHLILLDFNTLIIIQWVAGALPLGVKKPERETDHSPLSSAEVKE
jgi:hypothetical protein